MAVDAEGNEIVEGDDNKDPGAGGSGGDKTPPYTQEQILQIVKDHDKLKSDLATLRKKVSKPADDADKEKESDAVKQANATIKALAEKLKAIEDQEEQDKLKGKDENVKELYKANKRIAELEAKLEETTSKLAQKETEMGDINGKYGKQLQELRVQTLKSEILSEASKNSALSDLQVYRLVKDDFIYDEEFDRWIIPIYNKKGDLVDGESASVYIKKFLTDPANDNLVRSGAKGGSGEPPSSGGEAPKANQDKAKGNPPIQSKIKITDAIKKEAMMNDMPVEDWIALLQVKEDIRNKKKS